jgi:hypothetical protein
MNKRMFSEALDSVIRARQAAHEISPVTEEGKERLGVVLTDLYEVQEELGRLQKAEGGQG